MIYYSKGGENLDLSGEDMKQGLYEALKKLGTRKKVIAIPPDCTRFHSRAGELTRYAWEYYGKDLKDILPALGTHSAMTERTYHICLGISPYHCFVNTNGGQI